MKLYRATGDMTRPEAVEADFLPDTGVYASEENAWINLLHLRMEAIEKAQSELSAQIRRAYRSWENWATYRASQSSCSSRSASAGSGPT